MKFPLNTCVLYLVTDHLCYNNKDMREPFIITIDCSKILPSNENTIYSMCIDPNKMTIVYELVVWLHWIFSVEECFFLTFENSVIHELEDIEVLHTMKNFELKPCNQQQCVHTKLYRTLLSKLDFFTMWNNIKVPKYFLEKVSNVERKLRLEYHPQEQKHNQNNIKTAMVKSKSFDNANEENLSFNICNKIEIKQMEDSSVKKNDFNQKFYKQALFSVESGLNKGEESTNENISLILKPEHDNYTKNQKNKSIYNEQSNSEQINKSLSPLSGKSQSSNVDSLNSPKREFKKQSIGQKTELNKESNNNKSSRPKRPFSIGEILANIRSEYEKKNDIKLMTESSPLQTDNCSLSQNSICSVREISNGYLEVDEVKSSGGRKRKRTRRGGKKIKEKLLKSEENSNILEQNECMRNYETHKETKPYHIRFDSEEEEECPTENKDVETMHSENHTINLKTDISNNCSTNVEELICLINNKKQALVASGSSCSNQGAQDFRLEKDSSVLLNHSVTERGNNKDLQDTKNLSVASEDCEFNVFSPDTNALKQLKEKFPSPVIIERFY